MAVMHAGLNVAFLASFLIVLAVVMALPGSASGAFAAFVVLALGPVGCLAGGFVTLVGQAAACSAPAETRARGWAVGSLVLGLCSRAFGGAAVLLAAFHLVAPQGGADFPRFLPLTWVALAGSALAGLAEVVYLALFLRALAIFLGEELLARRAGDYARFSVTFTAVIWAANGSYGILQLAFPDRLASVVPFIPAVVLVELVCFLILFADFVSLIQDTRRAVARARTNAGAPAGQVPQPGR
jgi:hypothetical protein